MLNFKRLLLVTLIAMVSISCGTDGLKVDQQALSFTNTGELVDNDYVQVGQQYSFTLNIENGTATDANLTAFTPGGSWLKAEVVNNGSAIQLSGTPSSQNGGNEFSYSITAIQDAGLNTSTSFSIYVDQ